MNAIRALRALGPIDVKNVRRDSLLRWMVFIPLVVALVVRWGVPYATRRSMEQFQFDLSPYYMLIISLLVMMAPMLFGMVIGFLLLDQRDDRTLMALQVTPLALNGYMAYRVAMPILLGVLLTMIVIPLAGLVTVGWLTIFLVAVATAPLTPVFALFFAAFAQNKVQGLALMKVTGVVLVPPLIAYFVRSSWQLAFGLIPTYWPARLFWSLQTGDSNAWIYLVAGLAYQIVLLVAMLRRFNLAMHR